MYFARKGCRVPEHIISSSRSSIHLTGLFNLIINQFVFQDIYKQFLNTDVDKKKLISISFLFLSVVVPISLKTLDRMRKKGENEYEIKTLCHDFYRSHRRSCSTLSAVERVIIKVHRASPVCEVTDYTTWHQLCNYSIISDIWYCSKWMFLLFSYFAETRSLLEIIFSGFTLTR